MKRLSTKVIWCSIPIVALLAQSEVCGQAARNIARGAAAMEAAPLVPIFLQLFGNFGGVGAMISAGIWARGKTADLQGFAALVAAAGGLWSAYAWLGWPFVTYTRSGWFTSSQISEFSFMRLLGMGIFALVGVMVYSAFSNPGQQRK